METDEAVPCFSRDQVRINKQDYCKNSIYYFLTGVNQSLHCFLNLRKYIFKFYFMAEGKRKVVSLQYVPYKGKVCRLRQKSEHFNTRCSSTSFKAIMNFIKSDASFTDSVTFSVQK